MRQSGIVNGGLMRVFTECHRSLASTVRRLSDVREDEGAVDFEILAGDLDALLPAVHEAEEHEPQHPGTSWLNFLCCPLCCLVRRAAHGCCSLASHQGSMWGACHAAPTNIFCPLTCQSQLMIFQMLLFCTICS